MSQTLRTPAQRQQRLGWICLLTFLVGMVGLWLITPVQQLVTEHLLPHIGYDHQDAGFGQGFGALPTLVKDGGGTQPVPILPQGPVHAPEIRAAEWVQARPSDHWTVQVAAMTEESSVLAFLNGRGSARDYFRYFRLPSVDGSTHWIIVTGDYGSQAEAAAEAAGSDFANLPSRPLVRNWATYQDALKAVQPDVKASEPASTVIPVTPPPAPAASQTEPVASPPAA